MNRLFILIGLFLILIVPKALASTAQYPNPYRQTIWNNITDGIHTLGQSPQQSKLTIMKLHHARTLARVNSINQARRHARLQKTRING